ncbi:hypothetical protein [Streptomyces hygroscopicus]|uniref:hypothetical protein n=1 Tax=Streptomyces hygroscopicus TaxID=1912 RepID=UPI0007852463|nr:hypothetical protein [Streptomyces hygroscopicus]
MTANPLGSQYGTLIMYGWVGTDPRDGTDIAFLCLATPADGSLGLTARQTMTHVAEAFGFDPQPGSMTEQADSNLYLTFAEGAWARLVVPSGGHIEHPGNQELRQLARRKGEVVLVLSYLPLPPGVDNMAHADSTTDRMACAFGLIPVR